MNFFSLFEQYLLFQRIKQKKNSSHFSWNSGDWAQKLYHDTFCLFSIFVSLSFFLCVFCFILFSRGMNKRITRARYRFTPCSGNSLSLNLFGISYELVWTEALKCVRILFPWYTLPPPPLTISMSSSTNVSTRVLISGVNSA